jgi:voltage-gated potassium channel Kch
VVIAGYGRVGQMVAAILDAEKIPYVALDFDARSVAKARRAGLPVFYGDASRLDLLRRANLDDARALVLTMNNAGDAALIRAARTEWPALPVLARAHDEEGAQRLLAQGATHAVPETREVSLQLAGMVLEDIGVPADTVRLRLDEQRDALTPGHS